MMPSRPKPGEDEEDVLRLQEEFLRRRKRTPSVDDLNDSVVAAGNFVTLRSNSVAPRWSQPPYDLPHPIIHDYIEGSSTSKRLRADERTAIFANDEDDVDQLHTDSDHPPATVLCDVVVERDTRSCTPVSPLTGCLGRAFPVVHRCHPKELMKAVGTRSTLSIFAQQMLKYKNDNDVESTSSSKIAVVKRPPTSASNTSCVVDGTGLNNAPGSSEQLAREIHEENLATLSDMPVSQILEQQGRLAESLDPKLLEFVKSIGRRRDSRRIENDEIRGGMQTTSRCSADATTRTEAAAATTTTVRPIVFDASESGSKWLNMDRVESDKLAWTRPLDDLSSKPLGSKIQGYPARFDFDGALVSREAVIPVHQGLHHHGEEPEVAGYTLEELFIYGRSSALQQRVLALSTLSRILERNGEGHYDQCLATPKQFLPHLLDSGLVLLLRWALDDNTESCLTPTVAAIHALLVSTSDEYFLDRTFSWSRGEEQPCMEPKKVATAKEKYQPGGGGGGDDDDDEDEGELSDAELVRLDVAKGLVRMDILPRLRYVLEVLRPSSSPTVVVHSLGIIVRLARHSLTMANSVISCPRLIETVVKEFIPNSWSNFQDGRITSVYGVPVRRAVKLVRTLASSGRRLAVDLLRHHDLMPSLLCYASADPEDSELLQLSLEAYRTWKVFLRFGLTVDHFTDFYPLIARQLLFYQSLCLNEVDAQKIVNDCDHASELIGLLTVCVPLADTRGLSWSLVAGLHLSIELCLKKWLWEMSHADDVTTSSLKLIGVTCTFVATFYEALRMKTSCHSVDLVARLDDLFSLAVVPFLESSGFRNQLALLSDSSCLLCDWRPGTGGDVPSLPFLGSLSWGGQLNPVLCERSPFPLISHLIRALLVLVHVHAGLRNKFHGPLFDNPELKSYLALLSDSVIDRIVVPNWFVRFETHFVSDLLALSCTPPELALMTPYQKGYHEAAAAAVLRRFQCGDEAMAIELLTSVIFNAQFISQAVNTPTFIGCRRIQSDEIEVGLEKLRVNDEPSSVSFRINLLRQTLSNLPSICSTYVTAVFRSDRKSTNQSKENETPQTLVAYFRGTPIVPKCFEYLPIVRLFFASNSNESEEEAAEFKRMEVVHCLQWSHLLDVRSSPNTLRTRPESKFCYLAMVTLISADVFLDPCVQSYLNDCVLLMAERKELIQMNLDSQPIPEIASFHDFYEQLVFQFEAVSYGDRLFGILVMVPMQMRYPVRLRRMVWSTEHRSALRSLNVRPNDLPIALDEFLEPNDTDAVLLESYLSALLNGQVRPSWCPLMYLVAIHHVHMFLFSAIASEERHRQMCDMLRRLRAFEMSDVYKHLTMYRGPNLSVSLQFDLADNPEAVMKTTRLMSQIDLNHSQHDGAL